MEKGKYIWMDGNLVEWDKANVHVLTHTLHYGLGVFEGIRFYKCVDNSIAIFRLKEHTKRLFESARIALMEIPFTEDRINSATIETVQNSGLKDGGYIRPLAFLGDGSMGVYPKNNPVRVAIATWAWGAYLGDDGVNNGIRVKIASIQRYHVNTAMTKSKLVGNYVNSILAKREVIAMGFDEALLLDTDGYVAEGSGENIFIVKDSVIKTTPLTSVLNGITRASVMKIAKDKGYCVREERFTRDELYTADEAFFTGTAAEVTPIREVDLRKIGDGKPGPITKEIQKTYFSAIRGGVPEYTDWLTRI